MIGQVFALRADPASIEFSGLPGDSVQFNFTIINDEDVQRNVTTFFIQPDNISCTFSNGAIARYDVMEPYAQFNDTLIMSIPKDVPSGNYACDIEAQAYFQDTQIETQYVNNGGSGSSGAGGYGWSYIQRLLDAQRTNLTQNQSVRTIYVYRNMPSDISGDNQTDYRIEIAQNEEEIARLNSALGNISDYVLELEKEYDSAKLKVYLFAGLLIIFGTVIVITKNKNKTLPSKP